MKKMYFLVYQNKIANVFDVDENNKMRFVFQDTWYPTECFCRGLKHAGASISIAVCNKMGDIINETWDFTNVKHAPKDLMK